MVTFKDDEFFFHDWVLIPVECLVPFMLGQAFESFPVDCLFKAGEFSGTSSCRATSSLGHR